MGNTMKMAIDRYKNSGFRTCFSINSMGNSLEWDVSSGISRCELHKVISSVMGIFLDVTHLKVR
jgi:hypothetical protein